MTAKGFDERFPSRDSPAIRSLASRVRSLRRDRGLSQSELAAKIGLEQNAISLIENGRANPTLITLEQLAIALGTSLQQILEPAGAASNRRSSNAK